MYVSHAPIYNVGRSMSLYCSSEYSKIFDCVYIIEELLDTTCECESSHSHIIL